MKKKSLTRIVMAIFFVPCFVLLTACTGAKETGFKVKIDGQTYSDSTNEIVLDQGEIVSYEAIAILDDDSEKAIDSSLLTITDTDSIIGTAPEVGEYQITFKYGDYPEIVINITIEDNSLAVPTASTTSYTYNATAQTLSLTGFDNTKMSITGNTATNVGEYSAVVSLLDKVNTTWADGSTTDKTIAWSITKALLAKPTATTMTYTYNTEDQNIVLTGYNSDTMTKVSGCTGKNADDYTAVISLKDKSNYAWVDETTTDISIEWTIAKAQAVAPTHSTIGGVYDPAKTLADYTLDAGFSWDDDTQTPKVNDNIFLAKYNPDAANYETAEVEITLNITKAQAVAPAHQTLSGTYDPDMHLSDYALAQYFSWENASLVPEVNTTIYTAKYNPDNENYEDDIVNITLNIAKAQAEAPFHDSLEGVYDPDKHLADYVLDAGFSWENDQIVPDVNTGEYNAIYNPDEDNYENAETLVYLTISPKAIPVPTLKEDVDYIYSGDEQEIQLDNFDGEIMSITGNIATNASTGSGELAEITITNNNYIFDDDTTSVRISWAIIAKTPKITLSALDKYFDGRCINNPRYELSDDVNSTYTLEWFNGINYQPILRKDVVNVGKYKITIMTDIEDNYAAATLEEEFYIYYDLSRFQVITSYAEPTSPYFIMIDDNQFEYTGSAIEPEICIITGLDNNDDPIFLNPEMYEIKYEHNTNYFDNTYFTITGKTDYCRGTTARNNYYIIPDNMFASANVNSESVTFDPNSVTMVDLDSEPTSDILIKLNLANLYSEAKGYFTYLVTDYNGRYIVPETVIPDDLQFFIPKESYSIRINYYEGYRSGNNQGFYIRVNTNDNNIRVINSINNIDYLDINTDRQTILVRPEFSWETSADVCAAIKTAIQNSIEDEWGNNTVYSLDSSYKDKGYDIADVTSQDNKIIFTLRAEGYEDIVEQYNIITTPEFNNYYFGLNTNIKGFELMGHNNMAVINPGMEGTLTDALNAIFISAENYYIDSIYADGYVYDSYAVANDQITITLTKADSPNIVLVYDIEDRTKMARTFIVYFESYQLQDSKISIDIENQEIKLMPGFDKATLIDTLNGYISQRLFYMNSGENGQYYGLQASLNGDDVRMIVKDMDGEGQEYIYTIDFTVIDNSTGFVDLVSFQTVNFDGESEFLHFNNSNHINIDKVLTFADSIDLSFVPYGGITGWAILNSNEEEVVTYEDIYQQVRYPYYVKFENIPGADTYTLIVYRGALETEYTITINHFDYSPFFRFEYLNNIYDFNLELTGKIKYVLNTEKMSPKYLYVYLGEIEQGIDKINISMQSIISEAYDQDNQKILDFNNVELKVLADSQDNKYSLMYGEFEGELIPIYLYHSEDPKADIDAEYVLKFANKKLEFDLNYIHDEDSGLDFYGDFVLIDGGEFPLFMTSITKSEIGYIEGDTSVNLEVEINDIVSVMITDTQWGEVLMGTTDHSGVKTTPVIIEEGEGGQIVTYMNIIISDISQTKYMPLVIQIVDDPVEE